VKSYHELALLLERELDRSMRDAAAKSYDKFTKNLMVMVTKGTNDFINKHTSGGKGTDPSTKDIVSYEFAITDLANSLTHSMQKQFDNKKMLMSALTQGQMTLAYTIRDAAQIFLPPSIKPSDFDKMTVNSNMVKMLILLRGYSRGSGVMSFKGVYISGKETKSNPTLEFYNLSHLSLGKDTPLHQALRDVMKAKFSGKSKQAMVRPMNEWIKGLEQELMFLRDIFIHEYIHFLDDIRYKSSSNRPGNIDRGIKASWDPNSTPETRKYYYTSDAEWNAYFQGAASEIEDAFASFLIAATNERAALNAMRDKASFNTLTKTAKCKAVAEIVVADLQRKVKDNLAEPWILDHLKKIGLGGVKMDEMGTLVMALLTWGAYSTSLNFIEDPKRKAKLVSRIVSLRQDIDGIIREYETAMSQGKIPSVQEFNKAKNKFKPGGNPTKSKYTYNLLYSGLMIGKKVFDPNMKVED
jgi:hypothetical protein